MDIELFEGTELFEEIEFFDEADIYNNIGIPDLEEEGLLSDLEAGFMEGYLAA